MQPLPTGAFPEEVAEETPVQSESEPKVLDPEEDLLCIAKTFSYLRESGESQGRDRPCPGKSVEELSSLDFESSLGSVVLPPSLMVEIHPSPEKREGTLHLDLPWVGALR